MTGQDLRLRDSHDVSRQHGEVAQLSHLDTASILFLKCRVSRCQRKHFQDLRARYAQLPMPVLIGKAL
jgi:hypothetical protein